MQFKGTEWKKYNGALLFGRAPHISAELTKDDKTKLLDKSKAYFLRWISDWDTRESEFWYVIKDTFNGLDELSVNTRSKVRRGFKNCTIKRVKNTEIATFGYEVYSKAFELYATYLVPSTQEVFKKNILASNHYDFWAVYEKDRGKMIAYSQNKIEDNSVNYMTIKFHPNYLRLYPSYILFFEMNRYYLEEKGLLYVSDGARSISHQSNIQNFLIQKFKFRKAYCRLNIVYRKDIAIMVKILYPWQSIISKLHFPITNKIAVLLKQEGIRRSFE